MLYKDNITKRMGLEEAIAERVEETGTEHHIYLEMLRKEHPCPRCGERTNKIHDYREQKIRDLPAFGEKTFLHLRKRRYSRGAQRFCDDSAAVFRHGKHPIQVSSRRAFHRRTPGKRRWREVSMYSNRSAEP